jgi:L-amino acid N-acyltransferase YncA
VSADLLIRDVRQDDAAGIVAVFNPIIDARVYTVFDEPFTVDAERAYIAGFPTRGIWKVAIRESDDRLVGFQVVDPFGPYTRAFDHVGNIGTYVDLGVRRQGVARALFAATFADAPAKGYEKLFTFVRADNPIALATYRSQGFTIAGLAKRHAKIDGAYVDEILIERAVS